MRRAGSFNHGYCWSQRLPKQSHGIFAWWQTQPLPQCHRRLRSSPTAHRFCGRGGDGGPQLSQRLHGRFFAQCRQVAAAVALCRLGHPQGGAGSALRQATRLPSRRLVVAVGGSPIPIGACQASSAAHTHHSPSRSPIFGSCQAPPAAHTHHSPSTLLTLPHIGKSCSSLEEARI